MRIGHLVNLRHILEFRESLLLLSYLTKISPNWLVKGWLSHKLPRKCMVRDCIVSQTVSYIGTIISILMYPWKTLSKVKWGLRVGIYWIFTSIIMRKKQERTPWENKDATEEESKNRMRMESSMNKKTCLRRYCPCWQLDLRYQDCKKEISLV